jgi:hypothetical protein
LPARGDSWLIIRIIPIRSAKGQNVIEFLCPNNHRIKCTDDQAGRAAKCPKCGVKFIIPADGAAAVDKTPLDQQAAQQQPANLADSHVVAGSVQGKSPGESSAAVLDSSKTASSLSKLSGLFSMTPSMPRLFAKLWADKPKDAILELILRNGEVYKPDLYSKKLSQQQQGVFAVKEMDGTYSIIIVSWDALSHVQIRKMHNLPAEFDGK